MDGGGTHVISFTVKSSPFTNKIIFIKSVIDIDGKGLIWKRLEEEKMKHTEPQIFN